MAVKKMNVIPRYISTVDTVKNENKIHFKWLKAILSSEQTGAIVRQVFCFFMGMLASRATIFDGYSPFGVAISASVPYKYTFSTAFGALIGCLLPLPVNDSIRYMAAILAVAALRWTLNGFLTVTEHPLFSPIIAAFPIFITGIVLSLLTGAYDSSIMVVTIIETLMSAGSAFFFLATVKVTSGSRGITALSYQELACVALCICTVLLVLSSIMLGPVSLGRILAVLAILFCAQYGGVIGGSVAGIATGAMLSFSTADITYIAGAYAFGGLMGGMFSKLSKVATASAFILANGIIVLQTGNGEIAMTCLYEVAIATVMFMLIPKNLGENFSRIFDPSMGGPNVNGLRESVALRMNFTSRTLRDVNSCVDTVSDRLKKLNISDINGVYECVSKDVCKNCNLKLLCWERDHNKTMKVFHNFDDILKDGTKISEDDFPEFFKKRCSKAYDLSESVNQFYHSYISNKLAEKRVEEARVIVGNQFDSMNDILNDLSKEINLYDKFDYIMAEKIKSLFLSFGINVDTVSCRINKYDILTIEVEARGGYEIRLINTDLFRILEMTADRELGTPCIATTPSSTKIQITEKAKFEVSMGVCQHTCNDSKLCGDNYRIFNDGLGNIVGVLSDGMGSGGRAAVDSAMTTSMFEKLTKAGLSVKSSIKIINSCLVVKSSDESLATLDIVKINLFTGKTRIHKAGATFTFIKHNSSVSKIDLPSLPLGILSAIDYREQAFNLSKGDIILMVSDGIVASGEEWVIKELSKYNGEDENAFSEKIVEQARFRRSDGHDDDITALVMKIN